MSQKVFESNIRNSIGYTKHVYFVTDYEKKQKTKTKTKTKPKKKPQKNKKTILLFCGRPQVYHALSVHKLNLVQVILNTLMNGVVSRKLKDQA